ncbi:MAG: hypothetical protein R3B40_27015 [Polyangiales bacterium]|nr:hypothetical protein [Myxococcales bacterium]MCB9660255.1 hypothetical protein [Sandaracinaceae bacterium]
MSATVTIIVTPADDEEAFESMTVDERRRNGHEWVEFQLGSGRLLDTFFMKATDVDLSVLACGDRRREGGVLQTNLLARENVARVIAQLEKLLEVDADATARALGAHAGAGSDVERVAAALSSGTWPDGGDPAEESAAFARQLLVHAVLARDAGMGVCWEYRGKVRV